MVKGVVKDSICEDDPLSRTNENGKRSAEDPGKEPKKRLKTKSLYRQPTANELNRLQETANLFNSNLFRLQVEEILEEVKVKEKTEKKFQQWFSEFKDHLFTIAEDDTEYDLTQQTLSKKLKVKLPVSSRHKETKCMFKFHKFTTVEIVGSYALGCSINSKLRVNVQITVPAETYTKNDSVNYRYHKKRAVYLAFVAAHLKGHTSIAEINYSLDCSETKPVLDVTPSGKLGKHLTVRIHLLCEAEAYKLHRFSPSRNNLREAWMFSDKTENNDTGPPTPYYNSSILQDLTASVNEEFLRETLLKCENLKQAVVLLKIWIRQRNLEISGFIVSMMLSHLVQTKRVNNIMSSYQIVRNFWIALKAAEWDVKGVSLYKGDNTPALEEFHQHFPVVFLDRTGYYNICWQMYKGTYDALKRESSLAIEMLDNTKINSFIPLFMTPVQPLLQFDHILRFKNIPKLKESVLSKVEVGRRLSHGTAELPLVTGTLHALLARGLGARAHLVLPMRGGGFSWPLTTSLDKARKDGYKEELSFGIILNQDNYMNNVEKGPPANLPEAEEFRAFWGEKSELRRFQDGSITETCVWDADSPSERRQITAQIINYLLRIKFGVVPEEVFHVGAQLERLLLGEEAALAAVRGLDTLRRDLRQLTNLPLDISAVQGVSSVFSYSEPAPAVPSLPRNKPWRRGHAALVKEIVKDDGTFVVPEYIPVNEAIIELGHSGKWPGEISAFRCVKAAFHAQIAESLRQQLSCAAHAHATHVDAVRAGLVFRLRVAHAKEVTLLRRQLRGGVARYEETDESERLQCETVLLPRLRGALHGLASKYPAFGPAACLVRRWLSAQLLAPPHFPAAAAELLAAAVFVRGPAPAAPLPAALKALHLLAHTDWRREMIVLDFNDDMTREEILELEQQFSSRSPQSLRMHIVTSCDGALPGAWTRAPDARVLARAQTLAASTLEYFDKALLSDMKDNVLGAFVPSLAGYDALLRLRPALVPRRAARVAACLASHAPRPIPEDVPDADVVPVVEFHPVDKYLDELRSAYDEFALFFHDAYGGDVIAVLWKPDINELKEFQVSNAAALKEVATSGERRFRVDKAALLEDFKLLGQGLVDSVELNS